MLKKFLSKIRNLIQKNGISTNSHLEHIPFSDINQNVWHWQSFNGLDYNLENPQFIKTTRHRFLLSEFPST